MKVSFNLLKQFVDLNGIDSQTLADRLTFAGIEVENIAPLAIASNLVIGKILSCVDHPNSDHLHILQVDLGEKYGISQIVCGAPNARKDLKVIVAMPGAKLANDITINKSKIRDVESNGMCCSLLELGVERKFLTEKQINGIEELNEDAKIGDENVLAYLGLDDEILDINVLANRPDLLAILNLAKEVSALFNRKLLLEDLKVDKLAKTDFKVESLTDKCKQFSIKEIHNIKNNVSPKWLKQFLMASNIRSINALVDIGNFVMLVSGQPLHMYDLDKLKERKLVVKDNYQGDFVALDDKTYKLVPNDIVITCAGEVMCLGGVMGAKCCEVDDESKNIVIEAASFHHANIRHTSSRLGLSSESSNRFCKGTNHFQYDFVLNYAAKLVFDICGYETAYENVTFLDEKYQEKVIVTSLSEINNRLGSNFDLNQVISTLESLRFKIKIDGEKLNIIVPDFRLDITCSADISEEVIRYLGFDKIKDELPTLPQSVGKMSDYLAKNRLVEDYLINQGLSQVLTYTLVNETFSKQFAYLYKGEVYKIINPLTEIHQYVRKSLLPSLLETLNYNLNHQNKDVLIFETSDMITDSDHGVNLAICLTGKMFKQGLLKTDDVNFYTLKGLLEGIMSLLGITKGRYNLVKNDKISELHPYKSALIMVENKLSGYFGKIHPVYQETMDIDKSDDIYVLELRLDKIYNLKTSMVKMKPISKYPYIERDLAFVIDEDVEVENIINVVKKAGHPLVDNVSVFDIYTDKKLMPKQKSVAIKLIYCSQNETLKDDKVNQVEQNIIDMVEKKFKAVLRK